MSAIALDLPGPSRRIRVEPLAPLVPAPSRREPDPARAPEREPVPERADPREPVPA